VEILWLARKLGYRIAEVPVTWINDPFSQVRPIRDSFRMLVDIFRIWLRTRRGSDQVRSILNIDAKSGSSESASLLPVDDRQ
jgi:hypothetical protein